MLRLHVWGPRALFTRPEMKAERVSYDIITPSAARGILEAIHWKPQMAWRVRRLHVLRPIRFQTIKRNEVGSKISAGTVAAAMREESTERLGCVVDDDRQQRMSVILRDVAYIIDAGIDLTPAGRADGDTVTKHVEIFKRRAAKGQYYHHPYLGCREFACDFALIEEGTIPPPHPSLLGERDLGWMLQDIDFGSGGQEQRFFRPTMRNGMIEVPQR